MMVKFRLEYDTTQDDTVWIMQNAINKVLKEKCLDVKIEYGVGGDGWIDYNLKIREKS